MVPIASLRLWNRSFQAVGGQHFTVVRCTYKTKTDRLCNGFFTLISETNPFDFYCVVLGNQLLPHRGPKPPATHNVKQLFGL